MSNLPNTDAPLPLIAHVDIDAFFAQVAQLDNSTLRGLPVAVAGSSRRAVVATASYEARVFGVHSALSVFKAKQLCPHLSIVAPDFPRYHELSARIFDIFDQFSFRVEPGSLDEGYLDLSLSAEPPTSVEEVKHCLTQLREQVYAETSLVVSAGAGTTKLIAKLASTAAKPDGFLVVSDNDTLSFLHGHLVRQIPSIGPKTAHILNNLGFRTVRQLASASSGDLTPLLSSTRAQHILDLAQNIDPRPVSLPRPPKSISVASTFEHDLVNHADKLAQLAQLVAKAHSRLSAAGQAASTLTVRWRTHDFTDHSHASTLPAPSNSLQVFTDLASALLPSTPPLRLLGVGFSGLSRIVQPTLDLLFLEPDGLAVGLEVNHHRFGSGTISELHSDVAVVRFNAGPTRTLLREYFAN